MPKAFCDIFQTLKMEICYLHIGSWWNMTHCRNAVSLSSAFRPLEALYMYMLLETNETNCSLHRIPCWWAKETPSGQWKQIGFMNLLEPVIQTKMLWNVFLTWCKFCLFSRMSFNILVFADEILILSSTIWI